jgi:hypothetical protein
MFWRLPAVEKIQLVCVIYFAVWTVSPPLIIHRGLRLVAALACALWFGLEVLGRSRHLSRISGTALAGVVFLFYSTVVVYYFDGTRALARQFHACHFLFFLFLFDSYRRRDPEQMRTVLWATLLVFPIWLGLTIHEQSVTSNISRILTRSGELERSYQERGVGGYGLVYTVLPLVPVLLGVLWHRVIRGVLPWLLVLINFLLGVALVIRAGFSIAIILLVLSCLAVLFVDRANFGSPVKITATCFLLLVTSFSLPAIAGSLREVATGTSYETKIRDVVLSMAADEAVGTVEDRAERYSRSFFLLIENPVLGTGSFADVGKHSAILDRYAQFGVFFGSLFAYPVLYFPIPFLLGVDPRTFGMCLGLFVINLGFPLLNNVFGGFGLVVFFLFPSVLTLFDDGEPNASEQESSLERRDPRRIFRRRYR